MYVSGTWREYVGRRSWFLFHSMAAKYPEYPSEDDIQAMHNLVATLGQLYPCKLCRLHLREQLRDPSLLPVTFSSRTETTTWWCKLHNIVNADLGKPQFDCNPFALDLVYLKDCGECDPRKKAPKSSKTGGKLDGPRTGPWDSYLYSRDELLFSSVKTPGDQLIARDISDLISAMTVFNDLFGVFSKSELRLVEAEITESPELRNKWFDELMIRLGPELEVFRVEEDDDEDDDDWDDWGEESERGDETHRDEL